MSEGHSSSPLHHVIDHPSIELPFKVIHLKPVFGLELTRLMLMELIAAALIAAIMIPLARHIASNSITRGRFRNAFEALLYYVRDNIARPAFGGHGADEFMPFFWTVFLFILFNNLLGMIPGGASATGNINVTATLSIIAFGVLLYAGVREQGFIGFWLGLVPKMDLPIWLKPFVWGLMFLIEVAGLFIRQIVLAIRLFANMLAGHIVLAVILGFILQAGTAAWYLAIPITGASLFGAAALSILELLVAFLQAFIFTFLSALFIGTAAHPHH